MQRQRERDRHERRERSRGIKERSGEKRREDECVYTCERERERERRRKIAWVNADVCAKGRRGEERERGGRKKEEAGEGGGGKKRYAGARECVTGMARGQLTFIILTLMDYLIPYIPSDPSLAAFLPPLRLQTPSSVLGKVQDNIHGYIQANAPRRPPNNNEVSPKVICY